MVTYTRIRIVYIAGPYRAPNANGILRNILAARELAIRVWQAGLVPLCPHLNSACMDGVVPDDAFLRGDLDLLMRCDAVLCLPNWPESEGARREIALANKRDIPIFYTIGELEECLPNWPESEGARREIALANERDIPIFYTIGELDAAAHPEKRDQIE